MSAVISARPVSAHWQSRGQECHEARARLRGFPFVAEAGPFMRLLLARPGTPRAEPGGRSSARAEWPLGPGRRRRSPLIVVHTLTRFRVSGSSGRYSHLRGRGLASFSEDAQDHERVTLIGRS
jgi:hypothetical protein